MDYWIRGGGGILDFGFWIFDGGGGGGFGARAIGKRGWRIDGLLDYWINGGGGIFDF
jgi:hypothetical protein